MKGLKVFAVVMLMVFVLTACSSSKKSEAEAKEAVKTAMENLQKAKSGDYSFSLDGEIALNEKVFKEEATDIDFDVTFSGSYDSNDVKKPKFSLKIVGNGEADDKESSFEGESRLINEKLYFSLVSLTGLDTDPTASAMLQPWLGKWWYISLPGDLLAKYNIQALDESELTPEQKKIKELAETTYFFKDAKFVGEENMDGLVVEKYTASMDEEAMQNYIKESVEILGESLTKGDVLDMNEFFKLVDFEGEMYVGKDDKTLRKMNGKVTVADDGKSGIAMKFDLESGFSNLNGKVSVEEPKDAQLFDLFSAMLGGGALPEGDLEVDSSIESSESGLISPYDEPALINAEDKTTVNEKLEEVIE